MPEEISEVRMRKVPITGKAPLRRWQVQMPRLMSNPKQIHKGASGGGRVFLWLALFRLRRHRRRVTSFNGSLEDTRDRRLRRRPRRPAVDAEQQHDEPPIRTLTAGRISSLACDRSTTSIL